MQEREVSLGGVRRQTVQTPRRARDATDGHRALVRYLLPSTLLLFH